MKKSGKKIMIIIAATAIAAQLPVANVVAQTTDTSAVAKSEAGSSKDESTAATAAGFDNTVDIPDGDYETDSSENLYISGGGRHAPAIHCENVSVTDSKATGTIVLDSGTYGYVTVEDDLDELNNSDNKKNVDAATKKIAATHPTESTSAFVMPVKVNEEMRFSAWSDNVNSWISPYVIQINVDVPNDDEQNDNNNAKGEETDISKTDNNDNTKNGDEAVDNTSTKEDNNDTSNVDDIIDDGKYDVEYKDAESKRFNVVKAVLNAENGEYTVDITLSGTGYSHLYPGSVSEAEAAGESEWSSYSVDGDGKYVYTIKLPFFNLPFTLASRAERDGVWYDNERDIIIYSKDTQGNELPTHKPVDEQPVDEQPVDEQPVDEQPVDEQPVDEQPVDEQPVDEQPVDEQPVDEQPVDEQPVDEQPVDEQPVDEQPVDEQSGDKKKQDDSTSAGGTTDKGSDTTVISGTSSVGKISGNSISSAGTAAPSAATSSTVVKQTSTPETGDKNTVTAWVISACGAAVAAGMALFGINKRKKENR